MTDFYNEISVIEVKDLEFSENLLIWGTRIWFNFDNTHSGFQFVEEYEWLKGFINFKFGIDGINNVEEITNPFNKIMKLTASYCFSHSGQFESCCRILSVGELNFLTAIAYIQHRDDQEGNKLISFWLPKFVLLDAFKQCIQIASGLEKAGYYLPLRYINKYRTTEYFKPTLH